MVARKKKKVTKKSSSKKSKGNNDEEEEDHESKLDQLKKKWKEEEASDEFQQVPKGNYLGVIYDSEFTESSNGNPMFKLTLQITDGEYTGRNVWDNIVITDKTIGMVKRKLQQLGCADDAMDDFDELEDVAESLRGEEVEFKLTYQRDKEDADKHWPRIRYSGKQARDDDAEKPAKKSKRKKRF